MQYNPLITIVIPTHNKEEYLEKTLSSILSQTYGNWECIIINDGSTDNSLSIAKQWAEKDQRFKAFSQENMGLSATRNRGIDLANGDYIIFIDSDDWIEKDFLSDFIPYLDKKGLTLPIQDFIKDFITHSENNAQGYKNETLHLPTDLKLFLSNYKYTQGYAWNKLFNISIIRTNNLYFPLNTHNEDEVFYLQYIKHITKITFIKKANYHYLQREGSLSRTRNFYSVLNYLRHSINIINYFKNILNQNKEDILFINNYAKKIFNSAFHIIFRNTIYLNNHHRQERLKLLKKTRDILLEYKDLHLPPISFIQKIDIFLLKNNFISLLDIFIYLRLKIKK